MATYLLLSILLMQFVARCSCSEEVVARSRKGLIQLNNMLSTVTGRSAILDYNGYGCYCGLGGKGTPVDATDRCCYAHDKCYGNLKNCNAYFHPYKYSCTGRRCACDRTNNACGSQACQCDLVFSNCAASSPFNPKYKNYRGKC